MKSKSKLLLNCLISLKDLDLFVAANWSVCSRLQQPQLLRDTQPFRLRIIKVIFRCAGAHKLDTIWICADADYSVSGILAVCLALWLVQMKGILRLLLNCQFPAPPCQIFLVAANWSVYSRLEQPQLLRNS